MANEPARKPPIMSSLALSTARAHIEGDERVSAHDAANALRLALHAAGITLYGLETDACTCGRMAHVQKVELGTVDANVAIRLAEVIAKGALA
jgi:hypothetical protein